MLKRIFISSFILIIVGTFLSSFVIYIKNSNIKKAQYRKIASQVGKRYPMPSVVKRFSSDMKLGPLVAFYDTSNIQADFKLIFELNFSCSVCITNLIQVYEFFQDLSNIAKVDFFLATEEKSDNYIKYWLDQILIDYNLYIIQKGITKETLILYLLDSSNNIIMAGDVTRFPFLKSIFIKKLKDLIKNHPQSRYLR